MKGGKKRTTESVQSQSEEEEEAYEEEGDEEEEEEGDGNGNGNGTEAEKEYEQIEENEGERTKLADGYYEIESVRRKRVRKGQVQYLIKWRGWSEAANTWEPFDNLMQCSDVIEAFEESLKSGKSRWTRKRKRKSGITSAQTKKKQPQQQQHLRSPAAAGTYNVPSRVVRITDDDPISIHKLNDVTRGDQNGETSANGVSFVGTSKKANENGVSISSSTGEEQEQQKEEKELNLKIRELRGATSASVEAEDTITMASLEGHVTGANTLTNGFPKTDGADTLANGFTKTDGAEPAQSGRFTGAKRRKSGFVKRFKKDPASCSLDEPVAPSDENVAVGVQHPNILPSDTNGKNKQDDNSMFTITEIIRPISYRASISNNVQEVLLAFEALRSDGTTVTVDNKFLKANNPLLLIGFYEKNLRYSPT